MLDGPGSRILLKVQGSQGVRISGLGFGTEGSRVSSLQVKCLAKVIEALSLGGGFEVRGFPKGMGLGDSGRAWRACRIRG